MTTENPVPIPVLYEDENEMIHRLPTHPFCDDPTCGCHFDTSLVEEYLNVPWREGHLTGHEAWRLFRGE